MLSGPVFHVMKLFSLLNAAGLQAASILDIKISAITPDSRAVTPGSLFVAIPGVSVDGHDYIQDALQRGAVAVVGEKPVPGLDTYFRVEDARRALGELASAWYGFPSSKLTVIGVTGTDGKTTTTNLIFHMLRAAGYRAGMISTVKAVIGSRELDTGYHVTTPDALELQRILARMVEAGLTHCVLEATSHGLGQQRVAGVEFDLGVITNITHEHLDYHGTYEAYRDAKAHLFDLVRRSGEKPFDRPRAAVVNRDDESYQFLAGRTAGMRTVSFGAHPRADVRVESLRSTLNGLQFEAVGPDWRQLVESSMYGEYNVWNILAAMALLVEGMGMDAGTAAAGAASMEGIPGRMERIDLGQDFTAIVDFAHTPNALENALHSARALTDGKVIAVFGSAGLRDQEKRRMMAEVSARLADETVLTAEDPRTEPLDGILEEMARGAENEGAVEGETLWRVPDRGDAIRFALDRARKGDLVISCGKGHEQSMCFGATEYPWDDRTAMRAALAEHLGIDGPDMPYLPTSQAD